MNKNYSVITNYGCHWSCPYCIVKNNDLGIEETDNNKVLETVKKLIGENKLDFLSISGGGDPLFKMTQERFNFYKELKTILNGRPFEMHSSYTQILNKFDENIFDTIVYHLKDLKGLETIEKIANETIRVVYVVQEHFTEDYVNKIVDFVKNSNNIEQLSFRQRVDSNYNTTYTLHDFFKKGHKKDFYYIEQDDYNNYIINDKINGAFKDFKEEI